MEKSYSVDIVRLNNVNVIDNHPLSNFISIKNKHCKYAYYRQITLDKALLEIKKKNGIETINSYYGMNIKPYIVAKRLLK